VDPEDEAPELALGDRTGRERLDEADLAVREALPPVLLDAIERVRRGLAVELEDRCVLRATSAPPLLGIREPERRPPVRSPCGEAGDARPDAVVDRHAGLERFLEADDPDSPLRRRVVAQREARAVGIHRYVRRGHSIAEAPVDRRLRR